MREMIKRCRQTIQLDIEERFSQATQLKKGESAIVGSEPSRKDGVTPSVVCKDDGSIELFSSSNLGIKINPITETISIIAPNISLKGNIVDINTQPLLGLRWNKKPLNLSTHLFGTSLSGPVDIYPGTILEYDTTARDLVVKMGKLIKGLVI